MRADLVELEQLVSEVVRKSSVGPRVRNVVLEADRDNEGSEFLRVILETTPLKGVSYTEIKALVDGIENSVADTGERFPSVRFAEAA